MVIVIIIIISRSRFSIKIQCPRRSIIGKVMNRDWEVICHTLVAITCLSRHLLLFQLLRHHLCPWRLILHHPIHQFLYFE